MHDMTTKYYIQKNALAASQRIEGRIHTIHYDQNCDIYDHAVILPLRRVNQEGTVTCEGGVCDENFNFLAGYTDFGKFRVTPILKYDHAYVPDKVAYLDETVIFSGELNRQFGHFITDSMTRLWYAASHPEQEYKVALLLHPHWNWKGSNLCNSCYLKFLDLLGIRRNWSGENLTSSYYLKFLQLLGIKKERIIIVKNPCKFKRVIVPKLSVYWHGDVYNPELFNIVYDQAKSTITPKKHKKLYLSRSRLPLKSLANESYFEDFFKTRGFVVIYPEQLPIEEQLAYVAGAEEIACSMGTLSHWALFARPHARLICLLRYYYGAVIGLQLLIDRVKNLETVFINTSLDFLPMSKSAFFNHLIGPTQPWKQFVKDEYGIEIKEDIFSWLNHSNIKLGDYLKHYLQTLVRGGPYLEVYKYRLNHLEYLKFLFTAFNCPDDYKILQQKMLQNKNSGLCNQTFEYKKSDAAAAILIKLQAGGKIQALNKAVLRSEKFWSFYNNRLYFLNINYAPVMEFVKTTVPGRSGSGIMYKGVVYSNVAVSCTLKPHQPGNPPADYDRKLELLGTYFCLIQSKVQVSLPPPVFDYTSAAYLQLPLSADNGIHYELYFCKKGVRIAIHFENPRDSTAAAACLQQLLTAKLRVTLGENLTDRTRKEMYCVLENAEDTERIAGTASALIEDTCTCLKKSLAGLTRDNYLNDKYLSKPGRAAEPQQK